MTRKGVAKTALGALLGVCVHITLPGASLAESSQATTLCLSANGISAEISSTDLGFTTAYTSARSASVIVNHDAYTSACVSLADRFALLPAFEGDIDLSGDRAQVVAPVAGQTVDCDALLLAVERALATGDESPEIEVPLTLDAPQTSITALQRIASEVDPLLKEPITLLVEFEGRPGGTLVLTPDDVRTAFQLRRFGEFVTAELAPSLLGRRVVNALKPLGEVARDAEFVIDADDRIQIVPSSRGLSLSGASLFASAEQASKSTDKKAPAVASKGDPVLGTAKAESLGIKGIVATFTTKYPTGQQRVTNIHKAAALLDGAICEAGSRFSMNQRIGKRTKKRGFVLAPSIGEGTIVETVGGGVSQVATTFYNAVFDAGYAIVSRKPHTRYFDRYPLGVEATLSWPRPDFVFRNDSKAAVLVKASVTEDSVTIKLYGDIGGRKVKRNVSKTFAPTDPRIDYEPDDTLPIQKPKIKDQGTKGFSVKVGRDIVFADGTKKHEERTVVYHGKPRVVAAHPCAIPKGEKGHRKKGCPKPDELAALETATESEKGTSKSDVDAGSKVAVASAPKDDSAASKDKAAKDAKPEGAKNEKSAPADSGKQDKGDKATPDTGKKAKSDKPKKDKSAKKAGADAKKKSKTR